MIKVEDIDEQEADDHSGVTVTDVAGDVASAKNGQLVWAEPAEQPYNSFENPSTTRKK